MNIHKGFQTVLLALLACGALSTPVHAQPGPGETMNENRMRVGQETLRKLHPKAEANLHSALDDLAPEMVGFVVAFGYGDILARPGLPLPDRQVATIAALAAMGNAEPQLRFHIEGGLNVGLSPQEVVETLYVTTVFAGFPAGLNALFAAQQVFAERGVHPEAPVARPEAERRARGRAALEATSKGAGQAVVALLQNIAPEMADFIIDFSYGDVISRPGLSPRRKEIAMIAASVARGTMRPQLKVHVKAGLNVGLARQEIVEVAMQMAGYAGFPAALNGLAAVKETFGEVDTAK